MSKRTALLILAAAGLGLGGCTGTAIKEGAGLALGARGSVTVLTPIDPNPEARPLGAYQRFKLAPLTDDMKGHAPAGLADDLPAEFEKQLAAKKIPNAAAGKTLLIRGKVLHYEGSSTIGKALGPVEFVVARVELVDESAGKVLGEANCVGRTTARVNLGVAKKAQGLAKAIVHWIDSRFPDDRRATD